MQKFYINNKIDWVSTIFYILGVPFRLIAWVIKKILKIIKRIVEDILTGIYKKLVAIIVLIIVILIIFYISKITNIQELNGLSLIAK